MPATLDAALASAAQLGPFFTLVPFEARDSDQTWWPLDALPAEVLTRQLAATGGFLGIADTIVGVNPHARLDPASRRRGRPLLPAARHRRTARLRARADGGTRRPQLPAGGSAPAQPQRDSPTARPACAASRACRPARRLGAGRSARAVHRRADRDRAHPGADPRRQRVLRTRRCRPAHRAARCQPAGARTGRPHGPASSLCCRGPASLALAARPAPVTTISGVATAASSTASRAAPAEPLPEPLHSGLRRL